MAQATLTWQGDLVFDAVADSEHHVRLDGDKHAGPSPMELVLMAEAACTAMDVISILKKKRQEVTGFEVRVEAGRRDEHPKIYTAMVITYIIRGHNVDPQAVERAIELSITKYCSVSAMLKDTVPVTTRYEIVPSGDVAAGQHNIESVDSV
ncbi:MAG: osmotically inducible protein OsmC [Herpetosiphonaceae bacterium]|nr:MAG: osmotically inducible protein OsmC [Herpetosiphonaceae bacterium]